MEKAKEWFGIKFVERLEEKIDFVSEFVSTLQLSLETDEDNIELDFENFFEESAKLPDLICNLVKRQCKRVN